MFRRLMGIVLLVGLLAACGAPAQTNTSAPATSAPAEAPTSCAGCERANSGPSGVARGDDGDALYPQRPVCALLWADKKGYYAAEGLKVNFDYNFETDVIQRAAQGTVQFGAGSGDFGAAGARAGAADHHGRHDEPEVPGGVL